MSTTVGEEIRYSGVARLINSLTYDIIKRRILCQEPELRNRGRVQRREHRFRLSSIAQQEISSTSVWKELDLVPYALNLDGVVYTICKERKLGMKYFQTGLFRVFAISHSGSYGFMDVTVTARYESLKDRVVIITGGGQGIGRGYAHHFAAQGAIPIIAELNSENAIRVKEELDAKGAKSYAIQTDVSDMASVTAMVKQVMNSEGRVDVLINNAAVFSQITMAPFWELPLDEWNSALNVNVTGSFYCARAVVPTMQEAKWGRIVNVASGTVALGSANYLHYITSKSAMIGMTRSMARELGPWNVTVNTFWPGIIKTEVPRPSAPETVFEMFAKQQCLPRLTTIEDLAKPMLFLCSNEASYMTGQIFEPDGGLSFN